MKKTVHLIPYDGIGGVESAARSMGCLKQGDVDFEIEFIYRNATNTNHLATYNPFPLLAAVKKITFNPVDLLIVSLWRAYIVGFFAKLFKPNLKLVVFIHLQKDAHWLDYLFSRLAIFLATEVWADSNASLRLRFPRVNSDKCRIISFVTHYFKALPLKTVSPDFIFWGRMSLQKKIERSLRIFADVHRRIPTARFWIIGPDGGELSTIKRLCNALELSDSVIFLGEMNFDEITHYAQQASFYLQTSKFEGMAMSVVEAMHLGLVPVVTPVGEIGSYCKHGQNALVVEYENKCVDDLLDLLGDDKKFQAMRLQAITTWTEKQLYTESVMQACESILSIHS